MIPNLYNTFQPESQPPRRSQAGNTGSSPSGTATGRAPPPTPPRRCPSGLPEGRRQRGSPPPPPPLPPFSPRRQQQPLHANSPSKTSAASLLQGSNLLDLGPILFPPRRCLPSGDWEVGPPQLWSSRSPRRSVAGRSGGHGSGGLVVVRASKVVDDAVDGGLEIVGAATDWRLWARRRGEAGWGWRAPAWSRGAPMLGAGGAAWFRARRCARKGPRPTGPNLGLAHKLLALAGPEN